MKPTKLIFLLIIAVFSFYSCSEEDSNNTPVLDVSKYYQELNISYGGDANQKFDLYLPINRTSSTKTMILVHGGGWSGGDKSEMNGIKDLIRQDFPNLAIVNINYRLADENHSPYPMQLDDITSIINLLKDKKSEYTISEKLGFIGTSGGAHLSLLWSYAFDTGKNVNMVCSIVGPTNLADPAYLNNTDPVLQNMLNLFGVQVELSFLKEVSPYYQATSTSPPTLLFYGGQDPLIPTTQGTAMRDKLESLEVVYQFTLYPNVGHGLGLLEIIDAWAKLKVFIEANL